MFKQNLLLEDFGSSLFGDRSVWKDVSDFIAYRSKYDQTEEPNTVDETELHKLLIKWKTAKTGELSNNQTFHRLLQQLVDDRSFDHITHVHPDIPAVYRGSSLDVNPTLIKWAKTTNAGDWKYTQLKGYDLSYCSKVYPYSPKSLITSWTDDKARAAEFLDNDRPVLYVCPKNLLDPKSFVFTGGDEYDNSFDAVTFDNRGENEILGIASNYKTHIMIEESRLMSWMNQGVIKRSD